MRPLSLLLTFALVGVCLGAEPEPAAKSQDTEPTYRGRTLSQWVVLTKGGDERWRAAAIRALGEMGPPAIPALTELLRDKDGTTRMDASWALGRMGPAALPTLLKLLGDKEGDVLMGAIDAISLMEPKAKTAIPRLIELVRDEDARVRRAAMAPRQSPPLLP